MNLRKKKAGPRGILKSREPEGDFHHVRYLPSEALAGFIEHYWFVSWDLRGRSPEKRETLPHPSVHCVLENGKFEIGGVPTGRFGRVLKGRGGVFGIKFLPGGFYPFVKFPISELTDQVAPIGKVFGSAGLSFQKAAAGLPLKDEKALVGLAEEFFLERLPKKDPHVEWIGTLVERIVSDREIRKVEDLIRTFSLDKRTLQRLFKRYVGIGPKWMIQRYRLHEALAQLEKKKRVDWSVLAQELGYFDQAHFIKDFKALVGRTPEEYRA